jgi:hypothetical protein
MIVIYFKDPEWVNTLFQNSKEFPMKRLMAVFCLVFAVSLIVISCKKEQPVDAAAPAAVEAPAAEAPAAEVTK